MFFQSSLILILVLAPVVLKANTEKSSREFVGVVQHTKGDVRWSKRINFDPSQKVQFKTFFHYNDELTTGSASHIKWISSQRCVAVVYENGYLQSPKHKSQPIWKTNKSTSFRWICPSGSTESLLIENHPLELQSAEIFYDKQKLYVVRGRVISSNGELQTSGLYQMTSTGWELVTQWAEDARKIWEFNQSQLKPIEATVLTEPKKATLRRWYIGPVGGGSGLFHENKLMEDANYGAFGARLMMSQKWRERSFIYSLTYHDTESDQEDEPGPGGANPGEVFNFSRSDIFNVEFGVRLYHDQSWSPYWKLGLAHESMEVDIFGYGFNLSAKQEFLHVTAALGVEKTFLTDWLSWGGLFVSGEVNLYQTLVELGYEEKNKNYSGGSPPVEIQGFPSSITRLGVLIYFGGVLTF